MSDFLDRLLPSRKLLRKAAGEKEPEPAAPPQDTRYIKRQIEEHMKKTRPPDMESHAYDWRKHQGGRPKVAKVMGEFKEGTLKSSSGAKVTKRSQALAIGMSEAGLSKKKASRK